MDASIKRNAKALFFITWAALILLLANFAQASQQVEFNYNGRVKHNGAPFDGTGYFKFALVSQNGQISYWSNDSTSAAGSEPSGYITSEVIDGFFNVAIGDTLIGMDPLVPTVFNEDERIYLRVWFCHDLGSSFQRLNPDRRVVNPALLGQQTFDEDITLYVDADNGDDANNGLTTDTAKQTIQAAWDVIPPLVRKSITIQVLPGVYREMLTLTGKTVVGGNTISIIGDSSDPTSVVISGADEGAPGMPVRTYGFTILQQRSVMIQGCQVAYCNTAGIMVQDQSQIEIHDVIAFQCMQGVNSGSSKITIVNFEMTEGLTGATVTRGVRSNAYSIINIYDSCFANLGEGMNFSNTHSNIFSTEIDNCGEGVVSGFSFVRFRPDQNTISNCTLGMSILQASSVMALSSSLTLTGNTTNTYKDSNVSTAGF
ncbi:hypothetical protein JXA32_08995 [Candidatus Sumerlaeota bacterium]|nr:hypothetical protein [Candidatus Sumerlaeota bacterium]